MTTTIALIGAGGKMGCRITDDIKESEYRVLYVEISEQGLRNLAARGLAPTPQDTAVHDADVVIFGGAGRGHRQSLRQRRSAHEAGRYGDDARPCRRLPRQNVDVMLHPEKLDQLKR